MSRRRFMARTSVAIDRLATELGLEPSERVEMQARMTRLNRDCGCALGGATMAAALLAAVAFMVATTSFDVATIAAAVAVVFVSSLLGKAVGLAAASLRLELLRRSLARRSRRRQGESHVYVY